MKEQLQTALNSIIETYTKYFPQGYVRGTVSVLGSAPLYVGLIADKNDCPNEIRDNDRAFGIFHITIEDGQLVLERSFHRLTVKPKVQHNALGFESVSFRKIKAKTPQELAKKFAKYMDKFMTMAKEQMLLNNIYRVEEINPKYLEVLR